MPNLTSSQIDEMFAALQRYDKRYDEPFHAVGHILRQHDCASKAELAALITWKHIPVATWMTQLLRMSDSQVVDVTSEAFAPGLTTPQRINALSKLPGCGPASGGAIASTYLAAWNPEDFGVYDKFADARLSTWGFPCTPLPTYFDVLRELRDILRQTVLPPVGNFSAIQPAWLGCRDVDIALFILR